MDPVVGILVIVIVVFFAFSGIAFEDDSIGAGLVSLVLGIFFLFILLARVEKEGEPKTSISAGEYNVLDVYVAGDRVNLILGLKVRDDMDGVEYREVSRFYEFPVSAFDGGQVNQDGQKLVVIESGSFKKLKIE